MLGVSTFVGGFAAGEKATTTVMTVLSEREEGMSVFFWWRGGRGWLSGLPTHSATHVQRCEVVVLPHQPVDAASMKQMDRKTRPVEFADQA